MTKLHITYTVSKVWGKVCVLSWSPLTSQYNPAVLLRSWGADTGAADVVRFALRGVEKQSGLLTFSAFVFGLDSEQSTSAPESSNALFVFKQLSEEQEDLHIQESFVQRENQRLQNEAAKLNQMLRAKDQVIRWVDCRLQPVTSSGNHKGAFSTSIRKCTVWDEITVEKKRKHEDKVVPNFAKKSYYI